MPKVKISEYSTTNSSNTDINSINIDEGCAPSGINNAIREVMVHLKNWQTNASGDGATFANLVVQGTGSFTGAVTMSAGATLSGTNTLSGSNIISGNINSSGTTNTFSGTQVISGNINSSGSANTFSGSVALSGGTANGVLYLNGSKVATSGSALVFDGTNFSTTGTATATKLIPTGNVTAGNGMYLPTTNTLAWSTNGVEGMRLDSSGNLGLGVSAPNYKLDIASGAIQVKTGASISNSQYDWLIGYSGTEGYGVKITTIQGSTSTRHGMAFYTSAAALPAERMRIDETGNLGLGVTPSAWGSSFKALEGGDSNNQSAITFQTNTNAVNLGTNNYYDGSVSKYKFTGTAAYYAVDGNSFQWYQAPSGTAGNTITFTQAMTLDASGNLLVGKTSAGAVSDYGAELGNSGYGIFTRNSNAGVYVNRKVNDGNLVEFYQDDTQEGTISVSGTTVSYNAFAGSHWSQLQDDSKPEILRGTVMESIDELCEWPDEAQSERLCRVKISDTAGSKKVYGVFMDWDNDWTATNDMMVTSLGAFVCRVNGSVEVQQGDLLESNGDGTARVQADDIIRSSTIGKVTSTVKTHEFDDDSYCVPTVLYCG